MHQFFVESSQIGKEYVTITGEDVRHIRNVLRMRAGEEVRISDGSGRDCFCEIEEVGAGEVRARILDRPAESTELPGRIFLFQAVPKGERMEYVIQKAVELGVYEIIPVEMKYCVVRLDEKKKAKKRERWQAVAESAAKQAKRSRIPNVHSVMTYEEALSYARECDYCLLPYENERGMAGTRMFLDKIKPGKDISVMIGPEGGFAKEEIAMAADMDVISLGRRILRTDTAAVTVLSALMLELEMKTEKIETEVKTREG